MERARSGRSGMAGLRETLAPRAPQAIAVLASLAILALLWSGVHEHLSERRGAAIEEARRDVGNISMLVGDHASRLLGNVDQILRLMQADHADDPKAFDFGNWTRLAVSLDETTTQMSHFDASGRAVDAKVRRPGWRDVTVADREYFKRLSGSPDPGLVVDRTMRGRFTGRWALQMARRLQNPDGSFAGVIVASLDPDFLARRFSAMDIGPDGTIALLGQDGYVRARVPAIEGMYETPASEVVPQGGILLERLREEAWGVFEAEPGSDGIARVYGYKALDGYPLVIDVGKSLSGVLAAYNAERRRTTSVTLLATLAILVGLGFVVHAMERRRRRDTALAAAWKAAARSDARYRALADAMPQLVWVMDAPDGQTSYVNRGYEAYFGANGRQHDMDAPRIHPEDAHRYVLFWAEAHRGPRAGEVEVRLRRQDGIHRWHKVVATPLRGLGDSIAGWLGTAVDIDDIVAGRQALQEATDLLLVAQEGAGAGTWDIDLASGRIELSRASASMHGRDVPGVLVTDEAGWRALVHPEDAERCLSDIRAAIGRNEAYEGEFRVRIPGGWRWIQGMGRAKHDREGRPTHMIGLNFDVTRRKEAEAALIEAKAEAERASAAKSDFLAAMSHEIRTPLNAIIGFTGLLADNGRLPAEMRRHAEFARTSGEALLTVVNDILDFSKVEAGAIDLDPRPFALAALVDNCVSIVRGGLASDDVRILTSIDGALPHALSGDEGRLRQVLLNLLNNAVKFTPRGTVRVEVESEGRADGIEWVRFSVRDTGIGIPEDKHDRIFRRFSQADGSTRRRFGGTGLGLAICRSLVEAMGGEIGFDSEEGKGSNFWFAVALPHAEAPDARDAHGGTPPARRPARILVAEDVAANQALVQTVLEASGHSVVMVLDGREAVAAAGRERPDLVLMDVQMPGMDGLEATRAIRSLPGPASAVPILAMTANVLPSEIARFREAGMDGHVPKPFDPAALIAEIDAHLDPRGAPAADVPAAPRAKGHDAIVRLLGPSKAAVGMRDLARQCRSAFPADASTPEGRSALRADAHALVSSAGFFGFEALSRSCADLDGFAEARVEAEGIEEFGHALRKAAGLARDAAAEAEAIASGLEAPSLAVVGGRDLPLAPPSLAS